MSFSSLALWICRQTWVARPGAAGLGDAAITRRRRQSQDHLAQGTGLAGAAAGPNRAIDPRHRTWPGRWSCSDHPKPNLIAKLSVGASLSTKQTQMAQVVVIEAPKLDLRQA